MMDAVSSMVLGLAMGAAGWWLLDFRRRPVTWVGAMCFVAAVYFLANGAIMALGRPVALHVITVAGAAIAASGVLADIE